MKQPKKLTRNQKEMILYNRKEKRLEAVEK